MSVTHCGLSGCALTDPVVCIKTGHVYERSIITHHIAQTGRCPLTNIEISQNDLLTLQISPSAKPKPLSSTTVPGLLQSLQEEWNSAVLEAHAIKKQNDLLKQELSHALYQTDAACRVIARLVKEKEELVEALKELSKDD